MVSGLLLQACATPVSKLESTAKGFNFQRMTINTLGFAHLVYTHNVTPVIPADSQELDARNVLHVYLEGDGSPWKYRVVVMPDPTPRDPLVLRLMAKDNTPSAYVGRPCYNGSSNDEGCDPSLWTSGRYSGQVVRSMTAVIKQLINQYGFDEVKLIGHSGGGALAMLIAQRLEEVSHVVTVAGNLDTDGWTTHHGYSPLYTSLNPARQPALPNRIKQWHFLGARDSVVPPSIVKGFIQQQANALGLSVAGFNHSCCWERVWPGIANSLSHSATGFLPGTRFKLPE